MTDAASIDVGGLGLGDLAVGGGAVESIVIPVAPVLEIAEYQESGEDE